MIPVTSARRRADEFAALVDGRSGARETRYADLLELVAELRETPAPAPRAEFVANLRASLLEAADEALVATEQRLTLPATTRTRRDRRLALAAGTLALVGASSSVAVASQSALPGDALYPIKRVIESAETSLQADEVARANHILDHASGRLDEAEALALRDSAESQAAIPDTLDDFVTQANQAADVLLGEYAETGDSAHVRELRGFTSDSLDTLAELKATLPTDYAADLDTAVRALLAIDARAFEACPSCGGLLDVPAILLTSAARGARVPLAVDPRPTIQAPDRRGQTPASEGPVSGLIDQLPGLLAGQPDGNADGSTGEGSGATGGGGSKPPAETPTEEPTGAVGGLLEPVTGEDGRLLTDDDALDGLLDPLLGPVTSDGGLLP